MTTLGDKLRTLRKDKGLTLEQLAEKTDSSKGYIWELENRDLKKPSAEKLLKIAIELGVTTEFLLNENKNAPDEAVMRDVFFRKFDGLEGDDQQKILQIIDSWSKQK